MKSKVYLADVARHQADWRRRTRLWRSVVFWLLVAVVALNVLDVATTHYAILTHGMVEQNPVPRAIMEQYGLGISVLHKFALLFFILGYCYLISLLLPRTACGLLLLLCVLFAMVDLGNMYAISTDRLSVEVQPGAMQGIQETEDAMTSYIMLLPFLLLAYMDVRDFRLWLKLKLIGKRGSAWRAWGKYGKRYGRFVVRLRPAERR